MHKAYVPSLRTRSAKRAQHRESESSPSVAGCLGGGEVAGSAGAGGEPFVDLRCGPAHGAPADADRLGEQPLAHEPVYRARGQPAAGLDLWSGQQDVVLFSTVGFHARHYATPHRSQPVSSHPQTGRKPPQPLCVACSAGSSGQGQPCLRPRSTGRLDLPGGLSSRQCHRRPWIEGTGQTGAFAPSISRVGSGSAA